MYSLVTHTPCYSEQGYELPKKIFFGVSTILHVPSIIVVLITVV